MKRSMLLVWRIQTSIGLLMLLVAATHAVRPATAPTIRVHDYPGTTAPITAADLASTNTAVSFAIEGSWSWLQLAPTSGADTEPRSNPNHFSLGVLNLLSFRSLWPDVLSVGGKTVRAQPRGRGGYVWRPDIVSMRGSCAGAAEGPRKIQLDIAYHGNATVCARYTLDKPAGLAFVGTLPPPVAGVGDNKLQTLGRTTVGSLFERKHLLARMDVFSSTTSGNTTLDRFGLLRYDLAGKSRSR